MFLGKCNTDIAKSFYQKKEKRHNYQVLDDLHYINMIDCYDSKNSLILQESVTTV